MSLLDLSGVLTEHEQLDSIILSKGGSLTDHNPVTSPKHYYHPSGIEVISITRHESFLRGNVIKYVLRAPYKGDELQDLLKAQQYLRWEIERVEHENNN